MIKGAYCAIRPFAYADYMTRNGISVFQHPLWVAMLALTCAVLWGWAYPLIKIGFGALCIMPEMTGAKMVFAGLRFALSGLIILMLAGGKRLDFKLRRKADAWYILLYALLNTSLHYACFYIGLSHSEGARAAILNSLGTFALVILACLFFKSDRLTPRKLAGCAVGIAGLLALNLNGAASGSFTFMGDGMIILNALCSAFAGLLTRGLGQRVNVFVGTGYSLLFGGAMLVIPGLLMHEPPVSLNLAGVLVFMGLVFISTVSFALYNKLLTCNPVGKIAIYNSLIPVVGAVTSCLCLGETFYAKYLLAGGLAALGIYLINRDKK